MSSELTEDGGGAEARGFTRAGSSVASNQDHRRRLLRVIGNYEAQVIDQKRGQFFNWKDARRAATAIKGYAVDHLSQLLETFERQITARGASVLWARTAEEARSHLREIAERHQVKLVVKSKSMTTEEIHLNSLFEDSGIKVVESDLGELIQQLSHEPPYHIVTPAMHRSISEISELFSRELGCPPSNSAEELTMAARAHLRRTYLEASLGVSGANFLVADTGAVGVSENEGNARLTTACPPVHVVVAGIEKIIPRLSDLALFLPLLATSGTGQKFTVYSNLFCGPRRGSEPDGPEKMYVILLDNGRSELAAKEHFREALRCIRCGACLNACPVYKTVGGHAYHTTYQGPIGSLITPHLRGLAQWNHLSFASSLCGACAESCPVEIPIHHLLIENRRLAVEAGVAEKKWVRLIQLWAFGVRMRPWLLPLRPAGRWAALMLAKYRMRRGLAPIAAPAAEPFSAIWKRRQKRAGSPAIGAGGAEEKR